MATPTVKANLSGLARRLVLDGLLLEGRLTILPGNLGSLRVNHCTLVPEMGGLEVDSENIRLSISLDRSICGPIVLPASVPRLSIVDSIVDGDITAGKTGAAIDAPGASVSLQASTVLGTAQASSLRASNSIFTHKVSVTRRQLGCVRFCYLPLRSLAPRRYRCQPVDAAAADRVSPQFSSVRYGEPDYGQLARNCPPEITTGAEDEGEMGAFHFLQQTHRLRSLRILLDEYLRFGLEAGILVVS
jgi:hypothetical protein